MNDFYLATAQQLLKCRFINCPLSKILKSLEQDVFDDLNCLVSPCPFHTRMNNLVFSIDVALTWPLIYILTLPTVPDSFIFSSKTRCCVSLIKFWYRTDDLTESLFSVSLSPRTGRWRKSRRFRPIAGKVQCEPISLWDTLPIRWSLWRHSALLKHISSAHSVSVSVSRECWLVYVLGLHWVS